jgi:hypothetical protein
MLEVDFELRLRAMIAVQKLFLYVAEIINSDLPLSLDDRVSLRYGIVLKTVYDSVGDLSTSE